MPLKLLPVGSLIHNIELKPGQGGQFMRSAGTFAKLLTKDSCVQAGPPKENKKTPNENKQDSASSIIRLKSGRLYSLSNQVMGTLGIVSSTSGDQTPRALRKAGENR